ncbi:hypothetical protein V6574_13675 [Streptomyces sp. SM1P]
MSAVPPDPPAPAPQPPNTQWLLFTLIGVTLVLLLAMLAAGTMYLAWKHPTFTAPLTAAGVVVGLALSTISTIVAIAIAKR